MQLLPCIDVIANLKNSELFALCKCRKERRDESRLYKGRSQKRSHSHPVYNICFSWGDVCDGLRLRFYAICLRQCCPCSLCDWFNKSHPIVLFNFKLAKAPFNDFRHNSICVERIFPLINPRSSEKISAQLVKSSSDSINSSVFSAPIIKFHQRLNKLFLLLPLHILTSQPSKSDRFLANSANNINWRKCRKPHSARRLTNRGFNLDD